MSIAHYPLADDGGDKQEHQHGDVEDDDAQQQEEHSGGRLCSMEILPCGGSVAQRDSCPRSSEWPRAQTPCVRWLSASPNTAALRGCAREARGQREAPGVPFNGNNALSASPQ